MTVILLCILGGICFIALVMMMISLLNIKVWIFTKSKREKKLTRIGFLTDKGNQEAPEVHLSGNAAGKAIGRIKMGDKNDNAYVELLDSPFKDDSDNPHYRTYGFITQGGLIYKQAVANRKPEIIGYTARPSKPDVPTSIGERNWRSLWLKCRLNVYTGQPPRSVDDGIENWENVSEKGKKTEPIRTLVINSEAPEDSAEKNNKQELKDPKDPRWMENGSNDDNKKETADNKGKDSDKVNNKEKDNKKEKGKIKQIRKDTVRKPIAYSEYTGIHSSRKDEMPPEARSAAFAMIYSLYNKQNYQEYYKSPSFGWKDTALLAAFVYAIIYAIWYMICAKVMGVRFIGFKYWLDLPVFATYFAVWAIVRYIKIQCIENSDTIQPKIDLFNKILGQRGFDITIIICSVITLAFTGTYYRFNFVPLALVMIIAVCINMGSRVSKERWQVKNPLVSEDDEDEDENVLKNPQGDIERIYEWELDSPSRKDVKGKLALYFDGQYIEDLRFMNPFYDQRKDKPTTVLIEEMFNYMREHKSVSMRSRYLSSQIRRICAQYQLLDEDALQFTLDFVQEPNIRFTMNRDSHAISKYEKYIRFPDETLYDKEADSSSKVLLAAVLFHYLGHNVVFLYSKMQHHAALGIQVLPHWINSGKVFGLPLEEATFNHSGKRYLFCETTSDGFRIGGTIMGMRFEDFETRVELPLIAKDADEDNKESRTCLYNWDLDSAAGNKLHGSFTLEFDNDEIELLRKKNPFIAYGKDGEDYATKINRIFDYQKNVAGASDKVTKVAEYIRDIVNKENLPEIDMVQFALDFCQAPNITYKVDNNSSAINFAEEYMRFPDEVLYDKEGDCDCKSSLTAALLKSLGYNTVIMLSQKHQHAGIGVEYKPAWEPYIQAEDKTTVLREYNGKTYLFCETTGDGFKVGQIEKDQSIQNFETIVEI